MVDGMSDMGTTELGAASTPEQARAAFRDGLVRPTCGIAQGYVQANLMILPKEQAFDFLLFAQRNPKPCPLLEVMEPGVPVRHITAGRNVPMYDTSIECRSAGAFHSTMVVSMRGMRCVLRRLRQKECCGGGTLRQRNDGKATEGMETMAVQETDGKQTAMRIDMNSDMGESFGRWTLGDDEALLDVVSSANVACGFHAGDPSVMLRTLSYAASRGVMVGAHVAYRDLAGFGRRYVDESPDELKADVMYQIAALEGMARSVGAQVRYVKPHGALYNRIVRDEAQAAAVVEAIRSVDESLAILTQPGAVVGRLAAQAGLRVFHEAFADRAYNADGTLVSRRLPDAVIADPAEVAARVLRMVCEHEVVAIDGTVVPLNADSVCVHGDSPSAVAMARAVRARLESEGVAIRAFAGDAAASAARD